MKGEIQMKKLFKVVLSSAMLCTLAGCTPKEEKTEEDIYAKYLSAVDSKYAYDVAYTLAEDQDLLSNELGYRSAGSDAEHAAADYIAKEMEALGLEVEKVPVTVDKWQFNSASLTIEGTDIDIFPASYQLSGTDEAGITAEIVDCGLGTAADYEGLDVEGKIALVGVNQWDLAWIDMYMEEAYLHGAAAVVSYDENGYGTYDDDQINVQDVCCDDLLPTVAISRNQYAQIAEALSAGNTTATLKIDNEYAPEEGTSYNVVGKMAGKSSDQQIIISGHYDIYFRSFQDDSSAIGTVLGIAKAMKDSGYEPENDILFIAHGSEEWGAEGTEFDWTTGAWEMINSAKPEWAGKTIAMINFEMTALYDGMDLFQLSCVPEYADAVAEFVDTVAVKPANDVFPEGIDPVSVDTQTMEDGVSYRWAGVPYFVNTPGFNMDKEYGENWYQQHYHTKSDDPSTYNDDVMKTHINTYGMLAMWLDQAPVMKLNLTATADALGYMDVDVAAEAGIDTDEYFDALQALTASFEALNAKRDEILEKNDREAGKALNQIYLDSFKYIQDHFVGIELSSTVTTSYAQYMENVELYYAIIDALENGEISNDEGTGALDLIWMLNGGSEYGFYDFSEEANLRAHGRLLEETNEGNVFWVTDRGFRFSETYSALYSVFAQLESEAPDFSEAIAIYKNAIAEQEGFMKEEVTEVISSMKELTSAINAALN